MGYRIAIVGATGNVGTEMLTILAESDLTVDSVHALASRKSVGREVSYGDRDIKCEDLERFDFTTVKSLSAKIVSISVPTLPVAPTTAKR